jgi:hypothetical protein
MALYYGQTKDIEHLFLYSRMVKSKMIVKCINAGRHNLGNQRAISKFTQSYWITSLIPPGCLNGCIDVLKKFIFPRGNKFEIILTF